MLAEVPPCQIPPKEYQWLFQMTDDGAPSVLSVGRFRDHLESYYHLVAAATVKPRDPLLPDVKDRITGQRRVW